MGEIVTVNFRGDQLYGFKQDDGVFVALKPMVEAMGLDWSAQFRRVQRDPILSEGIAMMATPFGRGGDQETLCINVEMVQGWLFTIDSSRIKVEEVRRKVQLYQRECYAVLHAHFSGHRLNAHSGELPDPETARTFNESVRLVTEVRQTWGGQAAREIYVHERLPITPSMLRAPAQEDLFTTYRAIRTDDPAAA